MNGKQASSSSNYFSYDLSKSYLILHCQHLFKILCMYLCFLGGYRGCWASQVVLVVKNPSANAGDIRDMVSIPGSGRSLEEGMAAHFSILDWRILWTEELGGVSKSQARLK